MRLGAVQSVQEAYRRDLLEAVKHGDVERAIMLQDMRDIELREALERT